MHTWNKGDRWHPHAGYIKHFFSCLLFYILFMSGTPLEFTKTSKGSKVTPNGTWERFDPLKRYFTPWWQPMKLTTELSKKIKKKKRKKNETLSSKMRIHYSSVSGSILPLTQRKVKSEPRLRLNNNKITTKWWHKRPGEGCSEILFNFQFDWLHFGKELHNLGSLF